jgi:hypothetical protein
MAAANSETTSTGGRTLHNDNARVADNIVVNTQVVNAQVLNTQ